MDGPGLIAGCLCHPFGCPARGRCQEDFHALHLKIPDNGIDGGRLAGTRAAGDDQQAAVYRFIYRLFLEFIQVDGFLLLDFKEIGLDFRLGDVPPDVQVMEHAGCIELQVIVVGGVDQGSLVRRLHHHLAVYLHVHEMLFHGRGLHL